MQLSPPQTVVSTFFLCRKWHFSCTVQWSILFSSVLPSFFFWVSIERLYCILFCSLACRLFLKQCSWYLWYRHRFPKLSEIIPFSQKNLLLQKMKFTVKFWWRSLYSLRNIKLEVSVLCWAESHLYFNRGKAETG